MAPNNATDRSEDHRGYQQQQRQDRFSPFLVHVKLSKMGLCRPVSLRQGASGSSTVAIDNKIEQAMDLVKSHLMFAVREEVEVLKERIAELLDRIAFLETENSLLRAAASPETLAELSHLENTYRISSSTSSSNTGGVSSTSSLGPTNNGNL